MILFSIKKNKFSTTNKKITQKQKNLLKYTHL